MIIFPGVLKSIYRRPLCIPHYFGSFRSIAVVDCKTGLRICFVVVLDLLTNCFHRLFLFMASFEFGYSPISRLQYYYGIRCMIRIAILSSFPYYIMLNILYCKLWNSGIILIKINAWIVQVKNYSEFLLTFLNSFSYRITHRKKIWSI